MKKNSTPQSTPSKAPFASAEFLDEHRALRAVLSRVRTCRDLHLLIPLLEELHRMLDRHFKQEEKDDGLFQAVTDASPRHLPRVRELLEQHGNFLETVQALRADVQELVEGPLPALFENTETLCRDLETHESLENELLSDALYRDLGESG